MCKWTGRALLSNKYDKTHTDVFNVPSEEHKVLLCLDNCPFPIPYSTTTLFIILFPLSCLSFLLVLHRFFVRQFLSFAIFPRNTHHSITFTVAENMSELVSLYTTPLSFVLLSLCLFPSNSSFTVSLEPRQGVRGDR